MIDLDRLDSELRAWLRRSAPRDAPEGVVARGMVEVRETAQRRDWRTSLGNRWSLAAALASVVVVGAVASVVMLSIASRPTRPSGTPVASASANPTASPVALRGFTTNPPTSPDAVWTGIRWRKLAPGDALAGVKRVIRWRGGFVAIGPDADNSTTRVPAWTSPDGVTWQALPNDTFGINMNVVGVAEVGNGLVALIADGGNRCISHERRCAPMESWTSPDGRTWTRHPGPEIVADPDKGSSVFLVGGRGAVLAANYDSPARVAVSRDGIDWTVPLPDALPDGLYIGDVWAPPDGWVLLGTVPTDNGELAKGIALWSSDAEHWTPVEGPLTVGTKPPGNMWGARTIIEARNGAIAIGSFFGAPGVEIWWQSSNGQHWTLLPGYPPVGVWQGPGEGEGGYPNGGLLSDDSRIVALHSNGKVAWTSFDGVAWTSVEFSGDLPLGGSGPGLGGPAVVFPGGVLLSGTNAWYGEAIAK